MKKPLISVIVPIYNVEKYLDKCISSISNQTYQNLEIILVDDGSPDKCPSICDEWAKKDERIIVIHKENGGAGHARNCGIEIATGIYMCLIDGDDYLSLDMIENLESLMSDEVDLVECDMTNVYDDNAMFLNKSTKEDLIVNSINAMSLHINDSLFKQTPPNKLYRSSIVKQIPFPIGKSIDDEYWTYRVISKSRLLVHTYKQLYAYRQQPNSVMHSVDAKKRLQAIEAKYQRHEFIKDFMPSLEFQSVYNLWFSCLYVGQLSLRTLNKEESSCIFNELYLILNKYQLKFDCKTRIKLTHFIWLFLMKLDFKLTCLIRNKFKIGY